MKFQQKKVVAALAYALGVGGVALLTAANASAADIKVDVTGSNIKRVEGEGANPITVFTREDIERTGATTAYELLNFVSSNQTSGNVSLGQSVGATTFSAQTASLRGLGGQATLVLVNGKRVQSFAGELQGVYGVNLDVIPFAAIDRVEVLTDGASAVYGSDAIGGVINFITRQDYQGVEVTGYYGAPTRSGGGETWQGKIAAGYGDLTKDKYNVFFSGSYQEGKSLNQSDRNFSKTSYIPAEGVNTTSGNTFPGYISTGGIGSLDYPNCGPANISSGGRCRFDPPQFQNVQSIPETKYTNLYGSGRYQFNADWQGYLTAFYSKSETTLSIQPVPISDNFAYGPTGDTLAQILLPPTSPFYPTQRAIDKGVNGQPLNVRYRCVECGNRITTDTSDGWQGVAGVKGNWKNWDMDFDFFYAQGNTKEATNNGFPLYSTILPLLNSGQVNLFGPNTPAVSALVNATNYNATMFDSSSKNYGVEGKASSDIYNLPAGPLGFAVGFVARKEELDQTPNAVLATGDVSGYGGNLLPVSASRRNEAAYVEFNVPVIKNLEVNLAVRYDNYSDFGGTTNPKISARWNPTPQWLFRGSWGTGFIAPALTQLFGLNTQSVTQAGVSDPIRCPITKDALDCDTQFGVIFGGNKALQPEKSTQWQVGAVWEPAAGFSMGADYYNIILKNSFSNGPSPETILNSPESNAEFAYLVTRAAPAAPYPNLPGRILTIDQRFQNLGEVKTSGIDVTLQGKFPNSWMGQFSVQLAGTYVIKYDVQQLDGTFAGFVSNAYASAVLGITPRWKHYAALNWNYGPWAATLGNTYQSGYIDANTNAEDEQRRVSALSLWDLQGSYTGFKGWTLTAGVKNLFDTDPPFSNTTASFLTGYDASYYDARARFVYASVTWAWK